MSDPPEKQSQLGSILQSHSEGAPEITDISPLVDTWQKLKMLHIFGEDSVKRQLLLGLIRTRDNDVISNELHNVNNGIKMETMRALWWCCRLADRCHLFGPKCVNSKGYSYRIRCMIESEFEVCHGFFLERWYALLSVQHLPYHPFILFGKNSAFIV